jgi:hypothetical protein
VGTTWTADQILALAPDDSSAKAGKGLASARHWVTLGATDGSAWGECQGSGKNPYQTQIDLSEPAFKCSCPSRKFPCKHGLGLFLLLEAQSAAFTQDAPPGWVSEWLASRTQRAEQRAQKAAEKAEAAPDPAAQAKRAADREKKVEAGIAEVDRWLEDLVRRGLAEAQTQPYKFWETPAARMVDSQAPGVARLLREMASVPASGNGWPDRLLERLGTLHLLLEGYRRIEDLPEETREDVRARIGWNLKEEEVLQREGVRDRWLVLGQRVDQEDRIRVQRTWVRGAATGRDALVLDFAFGPAPLDATMPPGAAVEGELAFYPSAYPQRALVKSREGDPGVISVLPGYGSLAEAADAHASALAADPWIERFPVALASVIPVRRDGWALRDTDGRLVFLSVRDDAGWRLYSLAGGHPIAVFGEWDGHTLLPLSASAEGRFHRLDHLRVTP